VFGFATIGVPHGVDAMTGRILASHEAGAGGDAVGGSGVGVGEGHPFSGETVDVWGFVISGSLAGEVGVAEVIGIDENDVWGGGEGARNREKSEECNLSNHT